jgi:hypothetical protein
MNLLVLIAALAVLALALAAFTLIFILACRLSGLPSPGPARAAIVVLVTAFLWAIIEGILVAGLRNLYAKFGLPLWEVWLVGLFAGFPVSLAVGTLLHRLLMNVSPSQAIEVWFFERLVRYSIAAAGIGFVAVCWLIVRG